MTDDLNITVRLGACDAQFSVREAMGILGKDRRAVARPMLDKINGEVSGIAVAFSRSLQLEIANDEGGNHD